MPNSTLSYRCLPYRLAWMAPERDQNGNRLIYSNDRVTNIECNFDFQILQK